MMQNSKPGWKINFVSSSPGETIEVPSFVRLGEYDVRDGDVATGEQMVRQIASFGVS